jgi:methionine-rich copper-binding protein CopC
MYRRRSDFGAGAAAVIAALALAQVVWAHADLVDAVPPAGSTVAGSPSEIRLTFSETLLQGSQVALYGENFQPAADVTSIVAGTQMRGLLSERLGPGTYTVEWSAATADLHIVSGSYPCSVGPTETAGRNWAPIVAAAVSILTAGLAVLIWYLNRRSRL